MCIRDSDTLKAMVLATVEQRAAMEAENNRIASEIAALKLTNTILSACIAPFRPAYPTHLSGCSGRKRHGAVQQTGRPDGVTGGIIECHHVNGRIASISQHGADY